MAHPAFAKLFVETEFVPDLGAILATRRRRSDGDPQVWAAHLAVVEGETSATCSSRPTARASSAAARPSARPSAIADGWPLSNTAGAVLDPIFSLRRRVRIPRGATVRIAFWTMAAATREEVLDLADKHHDADRVRARHDAGLDAGADAASPSRHRHDDAHLFQRLANHVLYSDPTLRPPPTCSSAVRGKASALVGATAFPATCPSCWCASTTRTIIELVRQLLRAHEYWRLKQLAVDLVILNERAASYVQDLQIRSTRWCG